MVKTSEQTCPRPVLAHSPLLLSTESGLQLAGPAVALALPGPPILSQRFLRVGGDEAAALTMP
jgi:hypothetical protein